MTQRRYLTPGEYELKCTRAEVVRSERLGRDIFVAEFTVLKGSQETPKGALVSFFDSFGLATDLHHIQQGVNLRCLVEPKETRGGKTFLHHRWSPS